jgi:hypothetical protein
MCVCVREKERERERERERESCLGPVPSAGSVMVWMSVTCPLLPPPSSYIEILTPK